MPGVLLAYVGKKRIDPAFMHRRHLLEEGGAGLGQPDEIAAAVMWLIGDGAASITGQAISVSGGETW